METRDPKSAESAGAENEVESKDPKSEATSSETLSDVEETKTEEEETGAGDNSSLPSPDGAFDDGRSGTNGLEDAGPM